MLLALFNRRQLRQLSDHELVAAFESTPSKLIVGEIFNRYGKLAFGINLKYLRNKADAEDVLMQTFETLSIKMAKSDIRNLKNWLYTVCRNESLMFLRKQKPTAELDHVLITSVSDDSEALEAVFTKDEKLTALEKAIQFLKNEQKVCVELFYLKRNCYEEVASQTGFDIKKVKSYIQNGKRNLKLILEEKDVFKS